MYADVPASAAIASDVTIVAARDGGSHDESY